MSLLSQRFSSVSRIFSAISGDVDREFRTFPRRSSTISPEAPLNRLQRTGQFYARWPSNAICDDAGVREGMP